MVAEIAAQTMAATTAILKHGDDRRQRSAVMEASKKGWLSG
jgi:predicted hotdog family 3-hydroxylacyl-ACP dehydratase